MHTHTLKMQPSNQAKLSNFRNGFSSNPLSLSLSLSFSHVHTHTHIYPQHSQVIREDMQIWSDSQMWPFSCYSFQKEGSCVPNLTDMSPEELRWKAYQAWADSAAQTVYQEELRRMLEQVMSVRRDLMSITAGRVQSLVSTHINIFDIKFQ